MLALFSAIVALPVEARPAQPSNPIMHCMTGCNIALLAHDATENG
jgi:hypothetical protein